MARQNLTGWLFVGPATIIVLGLSIFPAGWSLVLSLQKWDGFSEAQFVGGDNYAELVTDDRASATRSSHTGLYTAAVRADVGAARACSWRWR